MRKMLNSGELNADIAGTGNYINSEYYDLGILETMNIMQKENIIN